MQAVTTDDFVQAMADASGVDLTQFKHWYDQAGTPVLEVTDAYDAAAQRYTFTVRQYCPPTPGQPEKRPFHIPLALGLVGPDGEDIPLELERANGERRDGRRAVADRSRATLRLLERDREAGAFACAQISQRRSR